MNRKWSFAWMLAVVGVSIVFGMVIGGKLNAPRVMLAAPPSGPQTSMALPASMPIVQGGAQHFPGVVEASIPAVVQIVATSVKKGSSDESDPHQMFRDDPFFQFFFGQPDRQNQRRAPRERREQSGGSGFIVTADGYILTNNHVVDDATKVEVTLNDGTHFSAELVGKDPNIDLALLKIDPKGQRLPTVPFGDSDKLRIGQWVIAIGNPFQLSETVTVGVVSAKDRQVPIGDTDQSLASFIQTDAAINFGNSGGPLLDASGRVVGINTAINRAMMAEGIGFALPINMAKSAMEQLRQTGKVERGWIGITMTDINEAAQQYNRLSDRNGVFVQSVAADGPAEKAGVQEGDIIRKVDGEPIRNGRDLVSRIAPRKPGEHVRVEILRGGKTIDETLTLAARPDAQTLAADRGGRGDQRDEETESGKESEGLGIRVESLSPSIREQLDLPDTVKGVIVTDVETGSEAGATGLGNGDVITAVNDQPVPGISAWKQVTSKLKQGDAVKLKIVRRGLSSFVFFRAPDSAKGN
jgi:serine protease Do